MSFKCKDCGKLIASFKHTVCIPCGDKAKAAYEKSTAEWASVQTARQRRSDDYWTHHANLSPPVLESSAPYTYTDPAPVFTGGGGSSGGAGASGSWDSTDSTPSRGYSSDSWSSSSSDSGSSYSSSSSSDSSSSSSSGGGD